MIMLMRYFQSKHQLKYQSDVTKLNKISSLGAVKDNSRNVPEIGVGFPVKTSW